MEETWEPNGGEEGVGVLSCGSNKAVVFMDTRHLFLRAQGHQGKTATKQANVRHESRSGTGWEEDNHWQGWREMREGKR